jgi:hypothetical protein
MRPSVFRPIDPSQRPGPEDPAHQNASPAVAPTSGYNPVRPARRTAPLGELHTRPGPKTASWRSRAPGCRGRQLSWSSLPLRRVSPSESTPPRFANTGYVPPSGFRTLSAVSSSLGRPALFHAGNAHGVLALQGVPLAARFRRSSRRNCPLDVSPPHGRKAIEC